MKTKEQAINVKGIDGEVWHSLNGRYIHEHDTRYLVAFLGITSTRACSKDIQICNAMAYARANNLRWHDDIVADLYESQDRDWQVCMCVVAELKKRGCDVLTIEKMILRHK